MSRLCLWRWKEPYVQTQGREYGPVQRAVGIVQFTCLQDVCVSGEGNKIRRVTLGLKI